MSPTDVFRRAGGPVVVAGLSMGGTLALSLALEHDDIAGLIVINPLVAPPDPSFLELLRSGVEGGSETIPSIGSDIAKPGVSGGGYDATPIRPMLSLMEATGELAPRLGEIPCPALLFSSSVDHVVPTESSDFLEKKFGGPLERVVLEKSFHVATLDFDAEEIERRSLDFLAGCAVAENSTAFSRDDVVHVAALARLVVERRGDRALHLSARLDPRSRRGGDRSRHRLTSRRRRTRSRLPTCSAPTSSARVSTATRCSPRHPRPSRAGSRCRRSSARRRERSARRAQSPPPRRCVRARRPPAPSSRRRSSRIDSFEGELHCFNTVTDDAALAAADAVDAIVAKGGDPGRSPASRSR